MQYVLARFVKDKKLIKTTSVVGQRYGQPVSSVKYGNVVRWWKLMDLIGNIVINGWLIFVFQCDKIRRKIKFILAM